MRKSAAEYLKRLEMRVAHLERQAEEGASAEATLKMLTPVLNANGFSATYDAPSKSVHIDGVMGKAHWRPKNRTQLIKMNPKMRIPYTKMWGKVLMFAPPAPSTPSAKFNILPNRNGVILEMEEERDFFLNGERI